MPIADHANVVAVVTDANTLTLPTRADVIWMRQNYHDLYDPFMGPADVPAFNKAVYRALKPGGRFVIIDHVAPAGSKLEATNTTHRIDPDVVKADMAQPASDSSARAAYCAILPIRTPLVSSMHPSADIRTNSSTSSRGPDAEKRRSSAGIGYPQPSGCMDPNPNIRGRLSGSQYQTLAQVVLGGWN
jgi:SAM-dependent methyltransferase